MEDPFNHIDVNNEKVNRIINAAFEVFSKNDLDKASTNSIVKKAGISRGLLYHYFKDKQELFNFLIHYSLKTNVKNIESKIDWNDTDLMNRFKQALMLRDEVLTKYPYMEDFFQKYSQQLNRNDMRSKVDTISPELRGKIYSYNVDFSKIKEEIDVEKMIKYIKWTIKGRYLDYLDKSRLTMIKPDRDKFLKEFDEFFEFLKLLFYKKEYQ